MEQKRLLIVEDDLFLRDIYCETVKNAGYQVDFAKDGNEAMEKIKQGGWDLILLDVLLPGMTGIEIMQKLKGEQLEKTNKKVVFLTNMDNPKEMKEIQDLGIDYWRKTDLTPDIFLNKIKSNLN